MAYVKFEDNENNSELKQEYDLNQWTKTTRLIECQNGYFEVGTKVKIVQVSDCYGYDIEDEYGNRINECGWII